MHCAEEGNAQESLFWCWSFDWTEDTFVTADVHSHSQEEGYMWGNMSYIAWCCQLNINISDLMRWKVSRRFLEKKQKQTLNSFHQFISVNRKYQGLMAASISAVDWTCCEPLKVRKHRQEGAVGSKGKIMRKIIESYTLLALSCIVVPNESSTKETLSLILHLSVSVFYSLFPSVCVSIFVHISIPSLHFSFLPV